MLLLVEQRELATSGLQHKPELCCNQVCWVLKVQAHFTPLKCMRKDSRAPLGIQGTLQDRVPVCVQVSITTGNCLGISQTESYNPPEGVAALMLLPLLLGDPLCRSGQDSAKHGTKLVWTGDSWCPQRVTMGWIYTLANNHTCLLLGRLGPAFSDVAHLAVQGCHPQADSNALLKQAT